MTETLERNATPGAANSDSISMSPQPPKLLDQVRDRIRIKHYSLATEKTYLYWIRYYVRWSGMRHPRDMGAADAEAFLSYLATARDVAAGTQNQAMHAVLFLYKEVLGITLPWLDGITRAKVTKRLPVVLTVAEVQRLLRHVDGTNGLIVRLLYGTGMRIKEALRLRIKDIDFARGEIIIREGKEIGRAHV